MSIFLVAVVAVAAFTIGPTYYAAARCDRVLDLSHQQLGPAGAASVDERDSRHI